jgi:methylated-DNA-protein-cysteine methyltransferase-like protein
MKRASIKTKTDKSGARAAKEASTKPRRGAPTPSKKAGMDRVFERIHKIVLKIPKGRVMTYGQIALLLDERFSPRLVGWAMHATPHDERNIPWHRVINSRGATSTGKVIPYHPDLQRSLLEAEGVIFNEAGHCDLKVYQWSPRRPRAGSLLKSRRSQPADHRPPRIEKPAPGVSKDGAVTSKSRKFKKTKAD